MTSQILANLLTSNFYQKIHQQTNKQVFSFVISRYLYVILICFALKMVIVIVIAFCWHFHIFFFLSIQMLNYFYYVSGMLLLFKRGRWYVFRIRSNEYLNFTNISFCLLTKSWQTIWCESNILEFIEMMCKVSFQFENRKTWRKCAIQRIMSFRVNDIFC